MRIIYSSNTDDTSESESDCDPAISSSSKFQDNSMTDNNTQCTSHCCKDRELPFQPRAVHTTKKQGKQNRSFNTHKWLSFCIAKEKVFCFYCHKAACNGKLPSGSRIDTALITTGFDNWKKAKGKFRTHEEFSSPRCLTCLQSMQSASYHSPDVSQGSKEAKVP